MPPNDTLSRLSRTHVLQLCTPKSPQARVHIQLVPLHPVHGKPFDSCDDFVAIAAQTQYAQWTQHLLRPVATLADMLQLTHQNRGYRLAADNLPTHSGEPFAWHLFGGQPLNKTLLREGQIGHAPFCETAFTQAYNTLKPVVYGKQFAPYFTNEHINKHHPQLIAHNATACSFRDKVPQLAVHALAISGKPYVSSYDFSAHATAAEIRDFFAVIKQTIHALQLQGKPYRLATNAGEHANHMVPHFHMHIGHDPAPLAPLVTPWRGHRLQIPSLVTSRTGQPAPDRTSEPDRTGEPAGQPATTLLSAHQVQQQVKQIAKQLRLQGVTPGQRVALCSHEPLAAVLGLLSCWQVGAVVAVCPLREPQHILRSWLQQLQCRCLLTTGLQQELLPDTPCVFLPQQKLSHKKRVQTPLNKTPARRKSLEKTDFTSVNEDFERVFQQSWVQFRGVCHSHPVMLAETTASTLLRTSGSSAQPKTALHTLQQHLANAKQAASNVQFGPNSRWLLSLPLYHVGGLAIVCRALITGGSVAVCQPNEHLSVDLLQRLGVTHLSVVTTQLQRLLQQPDAKRILSQLTAVLVGGGPLYAHVLQQAADWGVPVVTTYGCTEMASQITASRVHSGGHTATGALQQGLGKNSCVSKELSLNKEIVQKHANAINKEKPLSKETDKNNAHANSKVNRLDQQNNQGNKQMASWHAGPVLPDRQLRIAADAEILVKGPMLFCGYVNGEHIDPARDPQGWFHTGDIGFIDHQGHLHVQGRKDNRLVSGGENIQAEEIERALLQHPLVQQAVIVTTPCKQFGQRPVAFVKMADAAAWQPQLLRQHLEQHLARFKIPDHFLPWPQQIPCDTLKPPRAWLQDFFRDNMQSRVDTDKLY